MMLVKQHAGAIDRPDQARIAASNAAAYKHRKGTLCQSQWAQTSLACSRQCVAHMPQQRNQQHARPWQAGRCAIITAAGSSGGAAEASRQLQQVLAGIDAINSQDPRTTEWQGQQVPYEVAYSQWLSDWVMKLAPQPSEELQIVAHGQHVGRFKTPRSQYPEGREGYLKWREDLKRFHASTVVALMQQAGYPPASCEKVRRLILKRDLKKDAEAQALEDGLCLVFMQHQFADLLDKEGEDKMVDIVAKTWAKMGERGRQAALELAPTLPKEQQVVVQRALATKD